MLERYKTMYSSDYMTRGESTHSTLSDCSFVHIAVLLITSFICLQIRNPALGVQLLNRRSTPNQPVKFRNLDLDTTDMMPSVQTDRSSSVAGRTTERADDWPRNSQSDVTLDPHNQSKLVFNETLLLPMNDEMTITLLPAIICLALLMLVGSVGNSLSVYIFGWKLKRTTQNCLFMWLGVFDMVSCLIGIPSEIVDMAQYFLYENAVACKVSAVVRRFAC